LIAAAVYATVCVAILISSSYAADGRFVYPLDDTYINMAIAKNFALHGIWGVSPYQFSSATSTPFYALLLSTIYRLVGANQYVPLLMSWTFGLASIYVAAKIVAEHIPKSRQATVLVVMVLLTPLFCIGILGMEHSLHLVLTLLFLHWFDKDSDSSGMLAAITALMVATRYEGLFIVAPAFLILIARRKWFRAFTLVTAALLPVCGYAVFSLAHGGYWLPNSVSLKGLRGYHLSFSERILNILIVTASNCLRGFHLFLLLGGIAIAAFSLRKQHPRLVMMLALVLGAGSLHLVMADVGWAFRYEDYLIAPGIILAACAYYMLARYKSTPFRVTSYLFILAFGFLFGRALQAATSLPLYSRAVYLQQWQMANFLKTYYPTAEIAVNDIGAINFSSDFHCLDLTGLSSSDVFSAKRAGIYSTKFIDSEADLNGIKVAIIYDSWFSAHPETLLGGPPIPASWVRVRRWSLHDKEQLGDKTVSFYALSPTGEKRLRESLEAFERGLPKEVTATP
jgi:hypothetical protein